MSEIRKTFIDEGKWYKGNTHCHSTISDGTYTPEKVSDFYRRNGYSFLFITDHRNYYDHGDFSTDEFLVFAGVERDVPVDDKDFECFHIVGAYDENSGKTPFKNGEQFSPVWTGFDCVQEIVDDLIEHGNYPIFAHPVWSRNTMDELKALSGLAGIEIFNNVCEVHWNEGYSLLYWDLLWREGIKLWGFAADDTHNPEVTEKSAWNQAHGLGGWIVVKAKELTQKSIMDSLRCGSFYSSTGPEIYDFFVKEGIAYVECSDASAIHFMTYEPLGRSQRATKGAHLNSGQYTLVGKEKFIRVEITSSNGKRAWSNPIWLQ